MHRLPMKVFEMHQTQFRPFIGQQLQQSLNNQLQYQKLF
ncbi:unnamed protein product [Paramecium sonneborni]|uniref:Uncharacterized protein n=1 Tax=Paramecium sonneborni TaxID=65129 RepID=A0A8S1JVC5_9CILI|nr:unnamed protein product [Paramecium sonneborni]